MLYLQIYRIRETAKINYPIKTSFEMDQPRLLLISVDAKDCSTPVTFDSYSSYASKCDACNKEGNKNDSLVKHMKDKTYRGYSLRTRAILQRIGHHKKSGYNELDILYYNKLLLLTLCQHRQETY